MCVLTFCIFRCSHLISTDSPGPSQLSPALSSASSVSRNGAAPCGSTNTELLEKIRQRLFHTYKITIIALSTAATKPLFQQNFVQAKTKFFCTGFKTLTLLPPGRLSCCLDGSAELSETGVWHFQRNFYPPAHSWLP